MNTVAIHISGIVAVFMVPSLLAKDPADIETKPAMINTSGQLS